MSIIVNNTDGQLNININGVLDVYAVKSIKSVSRAVDATGNHYIAINFIANDKNNSLRIPLSEVSSPAGWTNNTAGAIQAVEDLRDWLGEVINVNLDANDDQVGIYGYTNPADPNTYTGVKVDASGVLAIQDNGGSITVDANDLDIRNLTFATDKVDASGSSVTVSGTVTANAGTGNFTVVQPTASNLNATVVGGTGVSRTPNFLRPTGVSGTVAAGTYSMSFASVGTANATVGPITLKPGETLNFDAGAINNTLGAVNYSTTTAGAELIIITLT